MGGPGAGKSALISMCAGKDVKPLHDPKSDITKVEDTAFMLNERVRVHLIDTPGFGHVLRSDVDIIQDIALWFSKSFEQGIRMSGVVFLHPINGAHMTRSQHHNILMFQKLCGEKAYPSVVLATTMWNFIDTTIAIQRERELIGTDALWDEIINKGCQIKDTQVGIQLNEYIIHEHAKFEAELRFTEERIQKAVAITDFEMRWMLGEGCNKLKEMIRFIKEEQTKLRQDLDVVQERKKRKFDVQLRSLDALFSLGQKNILNQGHDGREMIQGQAKNDEAHIDGDDMMLHDAIRNRETDGDEDMAELLLIKGADIEAKNNISGSTPLHRAAWNAQVYMVQLLLNQGANVEATDNDGDRPLHFAVQKREADITRLLLHQGANIEAKDSYGETPLHITASEGDVDLARLLLDQGADVNANNKGYRTPLQLAAESGHVDMARLLLDRGASINAWDENGNTALSLALREGRQDIVKLLRERGTTF
ncbi:ankyrin repeat-containing domain protein [Trichoderma asperelloides]|nr:ankyrin repeat-containing domain protein [Trichoderma asperelloides]